MKSHPIIPFQPSPRNPPPNHKSNSSTNAACPVSLTTISRVGSRTQSVEDTGIMTDGVSRQEQITPRQAAQRRSVIHPRGWSLLRVVLIYLGVNRSAVRSALAEKIR